MHKVLLQKMLGFHYQLMDMLCSTRKAAGGKKKKKRNREGRINKHLICKNTPVYEKKSYTSVISFRDQIRFFKLMDSDRQNISSEFIQRHPFPAPQLLSGQQPVSHFLSLSKCKVYQQKQNLLQYKDHLIL